MVKLFIIFLGSQVATSEAFGVAKVGRVDDDGGDDDDGEALKRRELFLEGNQQGRRVVQLELRASFLGRMLCRFVCTYEY